MSMNLAFEINGKYIVDFPFQTPTNLSYAVLRCKSNSEKLQLIENHLKQWRWNRKEIENTLGKIKTLLEDQNAKLIVL